MAKEKWAGLAPVSAKQKAHNQERADEITRARIIQRILKPRNPIPFRRAIAIVHVLKQIANPEETIHGIPGITKQQLKEDLEREFKKGKREVKRLRMFRSVSGPKSKLRKKLYTEIRIPKPKTHSQEIDAKARQLKMEGELMQKLFGRKSKLTVGEYQAAGEILRIHPHKILRTPNGGISYKKFTDALKRRKAIEARKRATERMADIANKLKKAGPNKRFIKKK